MSGCSSVVAVRPRCSRALGVGRHHGPMMGWRWLLQAMELNPEQIESLQVLLLATLPVALLWWLWIRMLRW